MDPQNILIALSLIAGLILLFISPSRAGMWRAGEFFCRIHAEANEHMDREKAARKVARAAIETEDRLEVR